MHLGLVFADRIMLMNDMELEFYKYQGTGNDFIMIDNRNLIFDAADLALVKRLCDRRFGIGADGLILIKEKEGFDFEMVYFNADGSQSMCGNGARCAVAFSKFLGLLTDECRFYAIDGPHVARYHEGEVELGMSSVDSINEVGDDFFLNTGSPHYVRLVENVREYPVVAEGARIRYSEAYPDGTNVNFVSVISDEEIFVRTYERGVEDETLSCGTGVTACALVFGRERGKNEVGIQTLGGRLKVRFAATPECFQDILLIGPAELVFSGRIEV
jgi:diaminopimelate epimerase